jgi:four helix bundle suffix protein
MPKSTENEALASARAVGREPLIPKHGGYRRLKTFQLSQLISDLTVRFCDLYVERRSRTRDQMEQAARSGTQNIAEASQASGTSKKTELKLTNVARASQEELRLDFEDFLRRKGLKPFPPDHPALKRFKARRCATLEDVRAWVEDELKRSAAGEYGPNWADREEHGHTNEHGPDTDEHRQMETGEQVPEGAPKAVAGSVHVRASRCLSVCRPCSSMSSRRRRRVSSAELVANGTLSLLNLSCYLLDRQIAAQAKAFEREGGFTERLYRVRTARKTERS